MIQAIMFQGKGVMIGSEAAGSPGPAAYSLAIGIDRKETPNNNTFSICRCQDIQPSQKTRQWNGMDGFWHVLNRIHL